MEQKKFPTFVLLSGDGYEHFLNLDEVKMASVLQDEDDALQLVFSEKIRVVIRGKGIPGILAALRENCIKVDAMPDIRLNNPKSQ